MKNSPMVTILMPVHNGGSCLREAIDSVLQQTLEDLELLIVDDCSTDESVSLIRSYGDDRIRLIVSQERLRICRALNLGLSKARGRYVARMDADDISLPRRLQMQLDYMESHPGTGLCGAWVRRFGATADGMVDTRPTDFDHIKAYSLFDNPMIHSTVMMRRDVLETFNLRYEDEFRNAEDYELWIRMFRCCRAENLPEVLLNYRVHPASVTTESAAEMDEAACRVLRRLLDPFQPGLTTEDILFHRYVGTHRLWPAKTLEALARAEKWLMHLANCNREKNIYSVQAFRKVIVGVWFSVCYHSLDLGWGVVRLFTKSDLARSAPDRKVVMILAALKRRLRKTTEPVAQA